MPKSALFLGSIGVVAETSDIQRRAYNAALAEAGVPWSWTPEIYSRLLEISGGKARLSLLAEATGSPLAAETIDFIHERKTRIACAEVRAGVALRPGVDDLLALARANGLRIGFVTSTERANIDAILAGAGLAAGTFDIIIDRGAVARPKPAPDAYEAALAALAVGADDAIAIEDTAASLWAARRAGVTAVATPGALSAGQDVGAADLVLDSLAGPDGTLDPRLLALIGLRGA